MSDIIYPIPPYLLHTCVGLELAKELSLVDESLAKYNFFPIGSSKYRFRSSAEVKSTPKVFSQDPKLNKAIFSKLRERFAAWGVLGTVPGEFSDDYIYAIYEVFEHRLQLASLGPINSPTSLNSIFNLGNLDHNSNGENSDFEDHDHDHSHYEDSHDKAPNSADSTSSSTTLNGRSIYKEKGLGEFNFTENFSDAYPFSKLALEDVLSVALLQREHKFSFQPYLMIEDKKTFLSPLPMYWTSLSVDDRQKTLERDLNMSVDVEDGYSVINLKLQNHGVKWARNTQAREYFNFIADKEVHPRTGIYYYEVTVEQRATKDTRHTTIIQTNDESVSSGSCILFSVGFAKRFTRFLAPGSASTSSRSAKFSPYIDLRNTQRLIAGFNRGDLETSVDSETVNFLHGEPGVSVDGSVAVSFNNSCSFAPVKHHLDSPPRTGPFGTRFSHNLEGALAGEQEISDLGIDIPFSTSCTVLPNTDMIYTSDVVGFGVNFVTKSLFVTVNGIIVKTIDEKDMEDGNPYKDTIFKHGATPESIYPMIGFQISDLVTLKLGTSPSETCVRTNFGHRNFRYDIDNYVRSFKAVHRNAFERELQETIRHAPEDLASLGSLDRSICDSREEHTYIHHFIKGYLEKKGYVKTLDALKLDIKELASHVSENGSLGQSKMGVWDVYKDDEQVSHLHHCNFIRSLITGGQYLDAIDYLQEYFPKLSNLEACLLELRLLDFLQTAHDHLLAQKGNNEILDSQASIAPIQLEIYRQGRDLVIDNKFPHHLQTEFLKLLEALTGPIKEDDNRLEMLHTRLDDASKLADYLTDSISSENGFELESYLEKVIASTRKCISELSESLDPRDGMFKLVNFDQEYLS